VQLLQQKILMLAPEGVRGVEVREAVGELAQGAAELVVFAVVVGLRGVVRRCIQEKSLGMLITCLLDGVAADYGGLSVVLVALVGCEVDFFEQLLLVVLEFADHGRGGVTSRKNSTLYQQPST
jgi:hypothetical protein